MARSQGQSKGNGRTANTGEPSAQDDRICGSLGQNSCNGALHNDLKGAGRTRTTG